MPDFENMSLDFSQFHPLDHSVWSCRGYHGGRRTHLSYVWEFKVREELHRRLLCPFGRHIETEFFYRRDAGTRMACLACGKSLD